MREGSREGNVDPFQVGIKSSGSFMKWQKSGISSIVGSKHLRLETLIVFSWSTNIGIDVSFVFKNRLGKGRLFSF